MLLNLHVKNFALIDDADVSFGEGLNIFTGETGAGKSLLIDAINAALGVKTPSSFIRHGKDQAVIELAFCADTDEVINKLTDMDAAPDEEGMIIIQKIIMPKRSINKINGSTVTASKVKEVTSQLVHIHGQNEHQYLFKRAMHLQILDDFCKEESAPIKRELADTYREYTSKQKELAELDIDEASRIRELDLLRYEINEIEQFELKEGEEDELMAAYKKMQNARKIAESLGAVKDALGSDTYDNAAESIGKAVHELSFVADYDEELRQVYDMSMTIESLVADLMSAVDDYLDGLSFSEEEHRRVENRLDVIRNMEMKYGSDIQAIMSTLEEKTERVCVLENLTKRKIELNEELKEITERLDSLSASLSALRKRESVKLAETIRKHLLDLNFLDVRFSMEISRLTSYTSNGYDEAEFYISTNPGEDMMPLADVASGGELSRVMLAIKTVLADADDIFTLIFDEIDTGISGRTAQKVSEKLALIAGSRQVICITHLAQIAAMADRHFRIEKKNDEDRTSTYVVQLNEDETVSELARILGGVSVTDAVMENAREMKKLANVFKKGE